MMLIERRKEADAAAVVLRTRKRTFLQRTRVFRAYCAKHRAGLIVGGGFASGMLMTFVPVAPFVRLASTFASTLTLMVNGPIAGFLAGYRAGEPGAPEAKPE